MKASVPRNLGWLVVVIGLLDGCAPKQAEMTPEGLLEVLGLTPGFSPVELPGDWAVEADGEISANQLRVVEEGDVESLRVANDEHAFIVVRRTRAMLLSTPFLSWSWNIESPSSPGFHPVRIIVGFLGGNQASGNWGKRPFKWFGSKLPPHDRALSLTWGESALQRGTLDLSQASNNRSAPKYTVRGGRENAGTWWKENVDLADIYTRAWPRDEASRAQIKFIGIAAPGGRPTAPAYVSGIYLTR